MSCDTHPKYKAVRKPSGGCEECWRFFFEVKDTQKNIIHPVCSSCHHSVDDHNEYGCTLKTGSPSCDDAYCTCNRVNK